MQNQPIVDKPKPAIDPPAGDLACPQALRLHRALGPLAAGLILDFADFATLGPIGLAVGLAVGGPIGWWLASIYGFPRRTQLLCGLVAGLYMTAPFTEILPVATIMAAIARYREAAA